MQNNPVVQLVNLRIGQHVSSFFRDADDGYICIVATDKIQHVVYRFPLFAPMLRILDEEWIFEYSVGDVLHQALSRRSNVPFVVIDTRMGSVKYNDRMWNRWLVDRRFKRGRSPIKE